MHRSRENLVRPGGQLKRVSVAIPGAWALVAIVALGIALGGCGLGVDSKGGTTVAAAEARTAPERSEPAVDLPVSDPTTSAPIVNPFSTFLQSPAPVGATVAAPSEPPLPFVFDGLRREGGQTVVVLSQQGRSVTVQGPGMLDAAYEVESIDERQIVLLHLPSMSRQVLSVAPAQASVPARVADAPVEDSEAEN
jgi:hypothetical protein